MKRKRVVRKTEKFSIRKEYKKCFDFLKESRNFIYSAILIFLIFTVLGFFFEDLVNMLFSSFFNIDLNERLIDYISRLVQQTEGMSQSQLIRFIFFNNLQSSFFGMIFGIFFGIFSMVAIISNGYILGFVASLSVKLQGVFVLWRILPHGIFELPAIFISLGLGLKLGMYVLMGNKKESFMYYLTNSLRVFLLVVLPLLIAAALIEGTLIALTG
jgi:stage II sporulation protein M